MTYICIYFSKNFWQLHFSHLWRLLLKRWTPQSYTQSLYSSPLLNLSLQLHAYAHTFLRAYAHTWCQFHQHYTYKFFVQTSFFYVHVTRKKLPKRHSYEKIAQKTLMKLTAFVRFFPVWILASEILSRGASPQFVVERCRSINMWHFFWFAKHFFWFVIFQTDF